VSKRLVPRHIWPMRGIVLALTGIALMGAACERLERGAPAMAPSTSTAPTAPEVDGRAFVVQTIIESGQARTLGRAGALWIAFDKGRLRAGTGCNTFLASYAVTDGRLVISGGGSTMKACFGDPRVNELEHVMQAFLAANPRSSVDDVHLVLSTDAMRLEAIDRRVIDPDRPLAGTIWQYTGTLNADGSVAVNVAFYTSKPTFVLTSNGTFIYHSCQRLVGRYDQAEGLVILVPSDTTGSVCTDGGAAASEARVLATLNGRFATAIHGPALRLVRVDGNGVMFVAAPTGGRRF
jgi:heat shock protein HslJ